MSLIKRLGRIIHGRTKLFLGLQAAALAAGNFVGWTTIAKDVNDFCSAQHGGLWALRSFTGTAVKNPLLTPCFWGSVMFLITFAWTLNLLIEKDAAKVRRQARYLWWVLLGGTLFAVANNILPIYRFYNQPVGSLTSCSNTVVLNPYTTSCFLGFSAYFLSFVFATLAKLSSQPTKN